MPRVQATSAALVKRCTVKEYELLRKLAEIQERLERCEVLVDDASIARVEVSLRLLDDTESGHLLYELESFLRQRGNFERVVEMIKAELRSLETQVKFEVKNCWWKLSAPNSYERDESGNIVAKVESGTE